MHRAFAYFIPFTLVAGVANAQVDPGDPNSCRPLADVIEDARASDPRTNIAAADVDAAQAEIAQTRSRYLPQLQSVSRVGYGDGRLADNQIDNQVGIQASQHVFSFGAAGLAMNEARLERRAARFGLAGTDQQVALETAGAVVELWRVRSLVGIGEARLAAFEEDLRFVRDLHQAQMATSVFLTEVEANVSLEKLRLVRLRNEEIFATARVARLAGPLNTCASEGGIRTFLATQNMRTLEQTVADALLFSPDIAELEARAKAQRIARKRIGRERFPELSVSAFAAYEFDDFPNQTSGDQIDRVGLTLRTDLFPGGRIRAQRNAAAARARRFDAEADLRKTQLTEEITAAWTIVSSRDDVLDTLDVAIDALTEQRSLREEEYRFGAASHRDLLDATNALFDAQVQKIEAQSDYFQNGVALIFLTEARLQRDDAPQASRPR